MRDYGSMSNQQLAACLRQLRRSKHILTCEKGHEACGCSNVPTMDGNAACSIKVEEEIQKRKRIS